jgi:hypothetical protein
VVLRAALEMSGRGIHVLPVKADKAIAATLSAINANRCSPPLEQTEIDSILKSTCRYAPDTAAPHVNGEVHAELDTFALAVYGAEWRGKAGKTDGDVLLALVWPYDFAYRLPYSYLSAPTGNAYSDSTRPDNNRTQVSDSATSRVSFFSVALKRSSGSLVSWSRSLENELSSTGEVERAHRGEHFLGGRWRLRSGGSHSPHARRFGSPPRGRRSTGRGS